MHSQGSSHTCLTSDYFNKIPHRKVRTQVHYHKSNLCYQTTSVLSNVKIYHCVFLPFFLRTGITSLLEFLVTEGPVKIWIPHNIHYFYSAFLLLLGPTIFILFWNNNNKSLLASLIWILTYFPTYNNYYTNCTSSTSWNIVCMKMDTCISCFLLLLSTMSFHFVCIYVFILHFNKLSLWKGHQFGAAGSVDITAPVSGSILILG